MQSAFEMEEVEEAMADGAPSLFAGAKRAPE
jgi:hypothetical protein